MKVFFLLVFLVSSCGCSNMHLGRGQKLVTLKDTYLNGAVLHPDRRHIVSGEVIVVRRGAILKVVTSRERGNTTTGYSMMCDAIIIEPSNIRSKPCDVSNVIYLNRKELYPPEGAYVRKLK